MSSMVVDPYRFAVAGFSPLDISGCVLWLDASDTATITSSGGVVSAWADKSATALSFTPPGTGPGTGNNTINGLNVVDFDNERINATSSLLASGGTIFVVWSRIATGAYDALPITLTSGSAGRPFDAWQYGDDTRRRYINGWNVQSMSWKDVKVLSTPMVWAFIIDKDGGGSGIHIGTERVNGAQTHSASFPDTYSISGQRTVIGGRDDGGTTFKGNVAEVVVYSSVLTGTNLTDVEDYLQAKWGTP